VGPRFVYIARLLLHFYSAERLMLRKYGWLIAFALLMFLFEGIVMHLIEVLTTEYDKCHNMDSVNPLKLVKCSDLNMGE